ncbi:MAG: thioredoxin family protein [Elusimicrobiota bacterium]
MKKIGLVLAVFTVALCLTAATHARESDFKVPKIGKPAPRFSAVDSNGKVRKLADEKGRFVVLEWTNHGCPYVAKHYDSGSMQRLQQTYTAKGVTWFSVISSAEGLLGFSTPEQANKDLERLKAAPTAVLLDKDGKLGRRYGATTTPEMFVIDPKGVLIYEGAIDDIRSSDAGDVAKAKNHVSQALDEALAGQPVTVAATKPYGCPVKYKMEEERHGKVRQGQKR